MNKKSRNSEIEKVKKEALRFYSNAKEILKKAKPDYETGIYDDIKYVQETFGTLWLSILKAVDYALLKKGIDSKKLPRSYDTYSEFLKKYLSYRNGKLIKVFNTLYHEVHIAGYYRGDLREVKLLKNIFKSAKDFINKLTK